MPLGMRQHNATSLHDLRSVTKSIVGLLYGIALSEGLVPGVQECLVCQFPEYEDLASDPKRREILIDHALSMKMGTEWNENIPYYDRRNSETAMDRAADPYRYVLDRRLINAAGNKWTYNGGATAIIARLIAKGAGKPIDQYAREKLFEPLGITDFEWVQGFGDEPSAASGLRLNIHDLAKIGQMIVDNGEFNGRQIVPLTWLESSFTPRASTDQGLRYGYFWRLAPQRTPPTWISGNGNGGQILFLYPGLDVVMIVFAGNYNKPNGWKMSEKVIREFLFPGLFR